MRFRTIGLISTLVLGLLAGPLPAEAQKARKVYRIGYLSGSSASSIVTESRQIAFRQRLRELGYVEGQNLVFEYRKKAAELVRLKVDVIFTSPGHRRIRDAQRTTGTIPIVMSGSNVDPVEAGFVVSLARPGGNITGLYRLDSELHGKRLELLKEVFPRISRVAILWPSRQQKRWRKEIEAVGQALRIQIQSVVISRRLAIESVFSAISRESPDGLLLAAGARAYIIRHRARINDFAVKRRLPTIYVDSRNVGDGGLMSYGVDLPDLYRQAATYVGKILKGAKPAELPVEQPTKFELVINLKTAKQLGITIPPSLLLQATKVIK